MELLREAATIGIIIAVVLGLNWMLRKAGFRGG
jgi:hypothetical protein